MKLIQTHCADAEYVSALKLGYFSRRGKRNLQSDGTEGNKG